MTNSANAARFPYSVDEDNGASKELTVVICPKAKLPAQVALDGDHGIRSCSRWNDSDHCSRTCLPQIRLCAEDLQGFAARYEGKPCTSCRVALTASDWYGTRLMALEADQEDSFVDAALLKDHTPICSSCFRGRMQ
jgi:hypothetical protein